MARIKLMERKKAELPAPEYFAWLRRYAKYRARTVMRELDPDGGRKRSAKSIKREIGCAVRELRKKNVEA